MSGQTTGKGLFTRPEAWTGLWYGLAVALSPPDEQRLRGALAAVWSFPELEGCYLHRDREPEDQARVDYTGFDGSIHTPLYGIALLGDGLATLTTHVVRESGSVDWLYVEMPLGSLGSVYPPASLPSGGDQRWRGVVDDWLQRLARHVDAAIDFDLGLIGWTDGQDFAAAVASRRPGGRRGCGYLVREQDQLRWLEPERATPERTRALAARDESAAISLGLRFAFLDLDDVVAWAAAVVAADAVPHPYIHELADASSPVEESVRDQLASLSRETAPEVVQAMVARLLAAKLLAFRGLAHNLASAAYELALFGHLSDPRIRDVALRSYEAFSLAEAGTIAQSWDEVADTLLEALQQAAEDADFHRDRLDRVIGKAAPIEEPATDQAAEQTPPSEATLDQWAPFDRLTIPPKPGQRKTRTTEGHLLSMSDGQALAVLLNKAGRPHVVRPVELAAIERSRSFRLAGSPADVETSFADVESEADVVVGHGQIDIAELPSPEGTRRLVGEWRRVRPSTARSGPSDGVWVLLRLGGRPVEIVVRSNDAFERSGTLFLAPAQLEHLHKKGGAVRPLGHGWAAITLPSQPLAQPLELLVDPARPRAVSLEPLHTSVVEILARDSTPLQLRGGPELRVTWRRARVTGYGALFGFVEIWLMVQLVHRGKPLRISKDGEPPDLWVRTDQGWLSAIKRSVVRKLGESRYSLRFQGRASTSLGSADYEQQVDIDLREHTAVLRTHLGRVYI